MIFVIRRADGPYLRYVKGPGGRPYRSWSEPVHAFDITLAKQWATFDGANGYIQKHAWATDYTVERAEGLEQQVARQQQVDTFYSYAGSVMNAAARMKNNPAVTEEVTANTQQWLSAMTALLDAMTTKVDS